MIPNSSIIQDDIDIIEDITVQEKISYYSEQYDISNEIPLMIARIESNFINECKNNDCSTGIGIYQISQSVFDEYKCKGSVFNVDDNIKCGIYLIKNNEYQIWEDEYDEWFILLSEKNKKDISEKCSCVTGARSFGGNIPIGTNANELIPNSKPYVGGIVIFKYDNNLYHVAVIEKMNDKYMTVHETNFVRCHETIRNVYYDDPNIFGFYKQ